MPAPLPNDALLWFLVLAENNSGTEGSWGTDSTPSERNGFFSNGSSGQCGNVLVPFSLILNSFNCNSQRGACASSSARHLHLNDASASPFRKELSATLVEFGKVKAEWKAPIEAREPLEGVRKRNRTGGVTHPGATRWWRTTLHRQRSAHRVGAGMARIELAVGLGLDRLQPTRGRIDGESKQQQDLLRRLVGEAATEELLDGPQAFGERPSSNCWN